MLPLYKQSDPRWGSLELAHGVTVARYGCFLTSLACKFAAYEILDAPDVVLSKLKEEGAFDSNGILDYTKIQRAYHQVHFIERFYTVNSSKNMVVRLEPDQFKLMIQNQCDTGNYPILSVDAVNGQGQLGHDGIEDHAVVLVDPNNWMIMDPIYGDIQSFSKRYGAIETGLYGFVAFSGPPVKCSGSDKDLNDGIAAWKVLEAKSDMIKKGFYIAEAVRSLIL